MDFDFLFPDELIDEYAYNDQSAPYDELALQYQALPFLAKLAPATAHRPRVRRDWTTRRGVYDECCKKPCSITELRSYCKRKNN